MQPEEGEEVEGVCVCVYVCVCVCVNLTLLLSAPTPLYAHRSGRDMRVCV